MVVPLAILHYIFVLVNFGVGQPPKRGCTSYLDKKKEILYNAIYTIKSPGIGGLEFLKMGNLAAAGIYL